MRKKTLITCKIVIFMVLWPALSAHAQQDPNEPAKPASKTPNVTKPLKVYILSGQSNMVGMGHINGDKPGTMTTLVKIDKKFQHLVDKKGAWKARNDVFFVDLTNRRIAKWMQVGVMGRTVGPEVQFGFIMGDHHEEMVLVIKAAQGNRAIGSDVMPPSSRIGLAKTGKWYKGWQYDAFVADIHKILDNLPEYFPDYKGQGYEIAGFCWWQGHKDGGMSQRYYERHLVNLIKDLRAEFKSPDAKFAVATVGFGGKSMDRKYKEILKAQMAVGDSKKYPKFAGNVASIDTRGFWRGPGVSPTGAGYHYNGNAETYTLVGDALGQAMVKMIEKEPKND